jgi:hypothetical protein
MERDEELHLRRLRRRAAKLGEMGMRIERPGVRLHGTERRIDEGYWLVDNRINATVYPRHAGGVATLKDIEAAIIEIEKGRGAWCVR